MIYWYGVPSMRPHCISPCPPIKLIQTRWENTYTIRRISSLDMRSLDISENVRVNIRSNSILPLFFSPHSLLPQNREDERHILVTRSTECNHEIWKAPSHQLLIEKLWHAWCEESKMNQKKSTQDISNGKTAGLLLSTLRFLTVSPHYHSHRQPKQSHHASSVSPNYKGLS